MTRKIDATRPFYAVVGAGDLAVELARTYTADVQARVSKIELEPQALRDQAVTVVSSRIDELGKDAKEARTQVEAYVNETVTEVTEAYGDLANRGRELVARIRRQQATQDAKAAAKTTKAKAKTAKTQTTKSAKSTAKSTRAAAKETADTAKTSAKSTFTAAEKSAEATTRAVADGAEKVGD